MTFNQILEEINQEVIEEGVSQEQKEKGQRAMQAVYADPINKLKEYLDNKWSKKENKTRYGYIQKKAEYYRFNEITEKMKKLFEKAEKTRVKAKKGSEFVKEMTGREPPARTYIKKESGGSCEADPDSPSEVKIFLGHTKEGRVYKSSSGMIVKERSSEFNKIIDRFVIYHEYGHLYEFLKEYVETGKVAEYTPTEKMSRDQLSKEEGGANAYALDNMYRKDRRDLLKNTKGTRSYYYQGMKKLSGAFDKTKESIKKEIKYKNN